MAAALSLYHSPLPVGLTLLIRISHTSYNTNVFFIAMLQKPALLHDWCLVSVLSDVNPGKDSVAETISCNHKAPFFAQLILESLESAWCSSQQLIRSPTVPNPCTIEQNGNDLHFQSVNVSL